MIHLGYMPLTDCAPAVVAQELGFFTEAGLTVRLEKQYSWSVMRDKLHAGVLDAAQCLAPMPLASTLGLSSAKTEVIAPMILSQNGNAITISESLFRQIKVVNQLEHIDFPLSATLLKPIIKKRKRKKSRLKFATVYPDSCHYYQLCSWFEHSGIRLSDIEIIIVTPSNMVEALACGDIDGFCVGGPWNAKAVRETVGVTGITSSDVWPDMPEKVLAFLNHWYQQYSTEAHALIRALQKACDWLIPVANRLEAANMLSQPSYLGLPLSIIAPSLMGSCLVHHQHSPREVHRYNRFADFGQSINEPTLYQGEWLLNQMKKLTSIDKKVANDTLVARVYRQDIYRKALAMPPNIC